MNVAEINEEFAQIAAGVFKRKFANKLFVLREVSFETHLHEKNDVIFIEKFNMTLEVFKLFGPFISKLKIKYERDQGHLMKQILKVINPDAIKMLHLENYDRFILNDITKPFPNAEHVAFIGEYNKLGSDALNLNEMFPKMRHLSLGYLYVSHRNSIFQHFEHLESLHTAFTNRDGYTEKHIEKLIEINPQIRKMFVYYGSIGFLQFLNTNLPNLEYLQVPFMIQSDNENKISLSNVKHLKTRGSLEYLFENVNFEQLQELELDGTPEQTHVWIEFIARNVNLKKLIALEDEINDAELLLLADNVPNLVEAAFILAPTVETETIVKFMKSKNQLQTLKLSCFPEQSLTKANLHSLVNQIETEWNISKTFFGYFIERKEIMLKTQLI